MERHIVWIDYTAARLGWVPNYCDKDSDMVFAIELAIENNRPYLITKVVPFGHPDIARLKISYPVQ